MEYFAELEDLRSRLWEIQVDTEDQLIGAFEDVSGAYEVVDRSEDD